jgi:peptidoglycan hydrolase-like protein with peptidoglycan-binding domain
MSENENTPTEEATVPAEAPAPKAQAPKRKPSPRGQVVGGGDVDEVRLSAMVYRNPAARKSLSVHHLQRRLAELGYPDAHTDKDGWYGDLTRKAVVEYQRDNGLGGDGVADAATLEHLFADDPNVAVVP